MFYLCYHCQSLLSYHWHIASYTCHDKPNRPHPGSCLLLLLLVLVSTRMPNIALHNNLKYKNHIEMWAYRRRDGERDASAILRHQRHFRVSNPGRDRIRVRFMRKVFPAGFYSALLFSFLLFTRFC